LETTPLSIHPRRRRYRGAAAPSAARRVSRRAGPRRVSRRAPKSHRAAVTPRRRSSVFLAQSAVVEDVVVYSRCDGAGVRAPPATAWRRCASRPDEPPVELSHARPLRGASLGVGVTEGRPPPPPPPPMAKNPPPPPALPRAVGTKAAPAALPRAVGTARTYETRHRAPRFGGRSRRRRSAVACVSRSALSLSIAP
jgi:hypothetical protein